MTLLRVNGAGAEHRECTGEGRCAQELTGEAAESGAVKVMP